VHKPCYRVRAVCKNCKDGASRRAVRFTSRSSPHVNGLSCNGLSSIAFNTSYRRRRLRVDAIENYLWRDCDETKARARSLSTSRYSSVVGKGRRSIVTVTHVRCVVDSDPLRRHRSVCRMIDPLSRSGHCPGPEARPDCPGGPLVGSPETRVVAHAIASTAESATVRANESLVTRPAGSL
jgi:hypothetical protein